MSAAQSTIDERFSHVFFVSCHGMAGDHWFDWFAKALNSHPDVMIYMGESVRSKYLKERSRKERPPLSAYAQLLRDLGTCYAAIGNCFCYRAYQLEQLDTAYGGKIRWANLVRHPYAWLNFYVGWRTSNMNMPPDNTSGIEHEWTVACHDKFDALGLEPYGRADIHVWAAYQGMEILNRMVSDRRAGSRNVCLETIVQDPEQFKALVAKLTYDRVRFDSEHLDRIYRWVEQPFRPAGRIVADPAAEYASWPAWKKRAFDTLVTDDARAMFRAFGYAF